MVHCLSLVLQPYVILCLKDLTQCNLACGLSSVWQAHSELGMLQSRAGRRTEAGGSGSLMHCSHLYHTLALLTSLTGPVPVRCSSL